MPNIPSLNIPFLPDATLDPLGMFLLCSGLLLIVYFALHGLLATRFGRVLVAIRENEQRVEFLGYDARLHKLVAFAIGGALAGLAGCLYVAWGNYVSPPVFSVVQSAQIIIWLMVGGVGTLLGPVLGAMAISWLTVKIGTQQVVNAKRRSWRGFTRLRPVGAEGRRTDGDRSLVPWLLSLRRPRLGSAQGCAGGQGMSPPLIETRTLSKHFGGVQAVRNIDFSLAEGELRCLIGPNGAGKSTFFKLLTGQIKPTSGAVLFRGTDITKLQAHEIARLGIGIKTQVPSVFNGLTARQNLWIAAARQASRREADAAVDAQIERFGLGRFADKPVGQLAHGQRQWVGACAGVVRTARFDPARRTGRRHDRGRARANHRDHPRDQSRAPADRGRARYVVHPNDRAAHHRVRSRHHPDGRRRGSGVRQSGRARRLSRQAGGGVILEINNLHAGYGRIPVLSGIIFTVGEHEVIGVLGHNGMGKTTLLKTLIGQVPLTGGAIRFAGCRYRHHSVVSAGARRHRLRAAGPRYLSQSDRLRKPAHGLHRKRHQLRGEHAQ